MPRLDLAFDLEPTDAQENLSLPCWFCERLGCEWKFRMPIDPPELSRGLHTKCKISLEQKRSPSRLLAAVKPP